MINKNFMSHLRGEKYAACVIGDVEEQNVNNGMQDWKICSDILQ